MFRRTLIPVWMGIIVALFNVFHSDPLLCLEVEEVEKQLRVQDEVSTASTDALDSFITNINALKRFDRVRVDPRKFEATYRKAKAVMSNVTEGVSYRQYVDLIQPLVSEISILEDAVKSKDEKFLLEAYRAASRVYTTTARFWSSRIQNGHSPEDETLGAYWNAAGLVLEQANKAYLRNRRSKKIEE